MDSITSALPALILFVYLLAQTVRKQLGHGWFARLLGLAAVLVPTASLLMTALSGTAPAEPDSLLLAVGAAGLGLGGVLFLLERKRPGYALGQSRGLFSAGVGLLLLATFFTTPLVMGLLGGGSLPDDVFAETAMASSMDVDALPDDGMGESLAMVEEESIASPTPSPTPQATALPSATPTFTPYPSATLMPTLPSLLLSTATPGTMPELGTPNTAGDPTAATDGGAICQVTTGANLNLRQSPGTDGAILTTIPNGTTLRAGDMTADHSWWQVSYDGQVGWVIRDYLYFGAEC